MMARLRAGEKHPGAASSERASWKGEGNEELIIQGDRVQGDRVKVPLLDLRAQYRTIREDVERAV
ncbi:MAG: hypothetical protein QOD06_3220, partial [Candidatus Binatota bacterium]|nr:hypothetical protein [Candidatus Binatota bacterium]